MKKRIFDHYEIDSEGYIINLKTNQKMLGNKNAHNPYVKINLTVDGEKKTFLMHKLLIMAFVDKYDERVHKIRFRDGDLSNCRLENLELTTIKWLGYHKILYVEPIIIIDSQK